MKIQEHPSAEQFEEFFKVARRRNYPDLTELADDLPPTEEALTEFYSELWNRSELHRLELEATFVHRWLAQQGNYIHALKVLYRRTKGQKPTPSREEYLRSHVGRTSIDLAPLSRDSIADIAYSHALKETDAARATALFQQMCRELELRPWNARINLRRSTTGNFAEVEMGIAVALASYFGDGHVHVMKRATEIEQALGSISKMRSKYKATILPEIIRLSARRSRPPKYTEQEQVDNFLSHEERLLQRELATLYPGRRHDPTLPERVLMWRLRSLFQREFKSDKPQALFLLLGLSGIRNSLEMSTIDRNLRAWRNMTAKLTPVEVDAG